MFEGPLTDVLHALGHVLPATASAIAVPLPAADVSTSPPVRSSSIHYGPDGTTAASKATAEFSGLTWGPDSKPIGGTLKHEMQTPDGHPVSSTSMAFAGAGAPVGLRSSIAQRFAVGVYKTVDVDFSRLDWSESGGPQRGGMEVRNTRADNYALVSHGMLGFDAERLQAGHFNHYDPAGSNTSIGQTHVDFSRTQFLGHWMVGGSYQVSSSTPAGVLKADSIVSLDEHGRPASVVVQRYRNGDRGKVRCVVACDFTGITYDAAGHFQAGTARIDVTDASGTPLSTQQLLIADGKPTQSTTQVFKAGRHVSDVHLDYGGAQFDNALNVVNSATVATVTDAATGGLLRRTTIRHDAYGSVTSKVTESFDGTESKPIATTTREYRGAVFGTNASMLRGTLVISTARSDGTAVAPQVREVTLPSGWPPSGSGSPVLESSDELLKKTGVPSGSGKVAVGVRHDDAVAGAATLSGDENGSTGPDTKTTTMTRSDGTLYQKTVTQSVGGRATSSETTMYATDGQTVIKTYEADLTTIQVPPAGAGDGVMKLQGQLAIQSRRGGTVLQTATTLAF